MNECQRLIRQKGLTLLAINEARIPVADHLPADIGMAIKIRFKYDTAWNVGPSFESMLQVRPMSHNTEKRIEF